MFPSGSILKQDATKSDYLILPLAAGVLAHFVLALEDRKLDDPKLAARWRDLQDDARAILQSSSEAREAQWDEDDTLYLKVRDVALMGWTAVQLWMPIMYVSWKFPDNSDGSVRQQASIIKWLSANRSAPLVDYTLVAVLGVFRVTTENDEWPLLSQAARKIRVEVADRLRRDRLATWPQIVRTVSAGWVDGGSARFTMDLANAAHETMDPFLKLADKVMAESARMDELRAQLAAAEQRSAEKEASPSVPQAEHDAMREEYEARHQSLHTQMSALRAERDALAQRDGRRQSHIDALTEKLAAARDRIRELEIEMAASQVQHSERRPETTKDMEDEPANVTVPADALNGRRVLLYTGEESGDARDALKLALLEYGASDVTCYWTDKDRGPDTIRQDAIIVIDVRHMSHSTYDAVVSVAEKSGAWYCITRRAAAGIGRTVAARWLARAAQRTVGS